MPRIFAELHEILDRVVIRLIDQIDDATDSNCYWSLTPDDLRHPTSSDFIYTVAASWSGNFDQGLFVGGGQQQAVINTIIIVTIWSTRNLDKAGEDERFLRDKKLGVMPRAKAVLKALAGHDLLDEDGNSILAELIHPQDYHLERQKPNRGSIQLGFQVAYDWDLN